MMWDGGEWCAILHLRTLLACRIYESQTNKTRWFSVTMGTGIVSMLLYMLPYNARWLYWVSTVVFALNVLLFVVACTISALRYALYPEIFWAMISHPVQSMFIGTVPMGFATIVNMFCFICVPAWGSWAQTFAWTIWIIDAVVSVVTALSLPFALYDTVSAVYVVPLMH